MSVEELFPINRNKIESGLRIELPYLRPLLGNSRLGRTVDIMGPSMRAGKTTTVKAVVDGLTELGVDTEPIWEEWEGNPHLIEGQGDSGEFMLSQMWFAQKKWEQQTCASGEVSERKVVLIQDVAGEADPAYPYSACRVGKITESMFEEYMSYYRTLKWDKIPFADLMIYLKISEEVLLKRAEASKREFETFTREDILMMKEYSEAWVVGALQIYPGRIMIVDTDQLDLVCDEKARSWLAEEVLERLSL